LTGVRRIADLRNGFAASLSSCFREERRSISRLRAIGVDRDAQSVHNMRPSAALALGRGQGATERR